jgi:putative transposase
MRDPNWCHPRRPPRLEQVFSTVPPVFLLTFNTYKRLRFLAQPEVHEVFQSFFALAQRHDAAVGRYIIMPDHVHVFLNTGVGKMSIGRWVQSLKSVIGKRLLDLGHEKPHWQEGFFDHLLRSDESYAEKCDYVFMNPVRAGLCAHPEDWPYQGEIVTLLR